MRCKNCHVVLLNPEEVVLCHYHAHTAELIKALEFGMDYTYRQGHTIGDGTRGGLFLEKAETTLDKLVVPNDR